MDVSNNPLISAAREARNPTRTWVAFLVALGATFSVIFGGPLLGLMGFDAQALQPGKPQPFGLQLANALLFALPIASIALWLRFKEKRPFSGTGFRGPGLLRFLSGLLLGGLSVALVVGVIALFGGFVRGTPSPEIHTGAGALVPVLVLLGGFFVQSSSEEVICRGYLLPVAATQGSIQRAVLLQSALFLLLHALNLPPPVAILNLLLMPTLMALVALKQGSLWGVCGWHAGWNWMLSNVLGIQVSGQWMGNSLILLQANPRASAALSGGKYGAEGSAVTTLFLLVGCVLAYLSLRRASPTTSAS